jgi:hypothetical protein
MQTARARDHVEIDLIPPHLEVEALKLRVFDPDSERPPEPLADTSHDEPMAPSLDDIRKQGGPSLEQLGRIVDEALEARGDIASRREQVNAVRPDGSTRSFLMPATSISAVVDRQVDQEAP